MDKLRLSLSSKTLEAVVSMSRVFKSHLKGNSVTDNKQIYLLITDNTDNTINGEGLSQMLIELYFHVHCGIKYSVSDIRLSVYCIFFKLANCYTINMLFYFLENSECEYNSSLLCFTVFDVHQFKAWLIW